jgi:hypothetical protein
MSNVRPCTIHTAALVTKLASEKHVVHFIDFFGRPYVFGYAANAAGALVLNPVALDCGAQLRCYTPKQLKELAVEVQALPDSWWEGDVQGDGPWFKDSIVVQRLATQEPDTQVINLLTL